MVDMIKHGGYVMTKELTAICTLRAPKVAEMLDVSPTTVKRWARENPSFPKPFKLSENVTVWDYKEVADWLTAQKSTTFAQA